MSASVASSAVGLLDRHYSPPTLSPEANDATGWPEMMEIDEMPKTEPLRNRSEIAEREARPGAQVEQENGVHSQNQVEQTDHDRQDAIGGLLAALATNGSNPISLPNADQIAKVRRSMTPPADSPISQTSQNEFAQVKEEGAVQEPNDARLLNDDTTIENMSQMPSFNNDPNQALLDQLDSVPFSAEDLASLPFPPLDMTMTDLPPDLQDEIPINVKRQIDAYARLEFADGTFYLNTYQCELGRDQHAYRDALQRDREAREAKEAEEQGKPLQKSSSGKASQRSLQIKAESQVQGSVVSEAGGFAGVDDQPVASHSDKRNGQDGKHHSSQASETSIVRPADVLRNPSLLPYDYHKDVVYQPQLLAPVPENDLIEDEQPAPVTSEHLPDPNSCPLIPIHATLASDQTEAESLKAISRRHIRIAWDSKQSAFYMYVLGRNGAFFEDIHRKRGDSVRLYTGARIQISAVEFVFRLPDVVNKRPEEDEEEEGSLDSEDASESSPSVVPASAERGHPIKLKLKLNTDTSASQTAGPNGELKRRGPGRPPKNGIMSQREMKEREKAEKEAKARTLSNAASPPALQRKFSKSQLPNLETPTVAESSKTEKRKYTKRKREDGEDEDVLPSIEAQEETPVVEAPPPPPPPQPVAKRARTKSFSPEYKPQDQCTPEDLARPPHNYAVLLYMVLSETGEITLRQIYKQMQSRWPYFKYVVDSDGWTSSVRHNLNQEVGKLFERGRKEGKGFTWLPKPNAMEEYQAQKNKRSNAPPVPKPRPPPQRPNYTGTPGQQLMWQNSTAAREPQQPGGTYPHQGPWHPQPNGTKPNQMPNAPNGQRPLPGQPPNMTINRDPNYIPPTHLLPQHFGRPAPRFMPVTFEGLAVIARFEQSMFQNLKQDEATQIKWRQIFASAKGRCLHGNSKSTLEGGETAEEATIIKHISDFVTRYKNPAFEGFTARTNHSPSLIGPNVPAPVPGASQTPVPARASIPPPQSTPQIQASAPPGGAALPAQPAPQGQASQGQVIQSQALPTAQTGTLATSATPNQQATQPQVQTQTANLSNSAAVGGPPSSTSSALPSQVPASAQASMINHQGCPPLPPQSLPASSASRPTQIPAELATNSTASTSVHNCSPPVRPSQSATPAPAASTPARPASTTPAAPIASASTLQPTTAPAAPVVSSTSTPTTPAGPITVAAGSIMSSTASATTSQGLPSVPVNTVQSTAQAQVARTSTASPGPKSSIEAPISGGSSKVEATETNSAAAARPTESVSEPTAQAASGAGD